MSSCQPLIHPFFGPLEPIVLVLMMGVSLRISRDSSGSPAKKGKGKKNICKSYWQNVEVIKLININKKNFQLKQRIKEYILYIYR